MKFLDRVAATLERVKRPNKASSERLAAHACCGGHDAEKASAHKPNARRSEAPHPTASSPERTKRGSCCGHS